MNLIKPKCLFVIMCLFISCSPHESNTDTSTNEQAAEEKNKKQYPKIFTSDSLRNDCINKLINDGDTVVYQQMYEDYLTTGHGYEFLSYAIIMANKHDYAPAYLDAYQILGLNQKDEMYLDKIKSERLYYLLKAYVLKDKSSIYHIKREFGNNYDSISIINYISKIENDRSWK